MLDFLVEDHIYSQLVSKICGRELNLSSSLHWDVSLGVQRSIPVAVTAGPLAAWDGQW